MTGWGSGSHLGHFSKEERCYLSCMKKKEGVSRHLAPLPFTFRAASLLAGELALFSTYMLFQP